MAFKVSNASDTMLISFDLRHSHHNPLVFTTKAETPCKGYERLSGSDFLSQGLVSLIAILQVWKELPKTTLTYLPFSDFSLSWTQFLAPIMRMVQKSIHLRSG